MKLFFPTRSEPNHPCVESRREWIDTIFAHTLVTHFLEFFQVRAFVAQFAILEAQTAILVRLTNTSILLKRHQTTLAHRRLFF